ncbi:MAG: RNA 2',3'-cyclic phosphodiesterase [Bacteroidales bacterium]|nr:RNA 2',3'-cyclic phosphodiesterase [Bacteroidales bacterium]
MSKRLFAAIKIKPEPEFLDILSQLQRALKLDKIKWVDPENVHLTLKFFGETNEDLIPDIIEQLDDAAQLASPFSLHIHDVGIFGSSYKPRVIWFNIEEEEQLQALAKNIQDNLKTLGYEPDRQNFVPHLTIGRIKHLKDRHFFQKRIDEHKEKSIQHVDVNEFYLMESILRSQGPLYKVVEKFTLGT